MKYNASLFRFNNGHSEFELIDKKTITIQDKRITTIKKIFNETFQINRPKMSLSNRTFIILLESCYSNTYSFYIINTDENNKAVDAINIGRSKNIKIES